MVNVPDSRSQPKGDYPSIAAMKAAVELEIRAAIGQVQTVGIGQLIQSVVEAESATLTARNRDLEAALREVARQHKTDEMCEAEVEGADFENAYDIIISRARAALLPGTPAVSR